MSGQNPSQEVDAALARRRIVQELAMTLPAFLADPGTPQQCRIRVGGLVHGTEWKWPIMDLINHAERRLAEINGGRTEKLELKDCPPFMEALNTIIPLAVGELIQSTGDWTSILAWALQGEYGGKDDKEAIDWEKLIKKERKARDILLQKLRDAKNSRSGT